jgi:putative flippase GtrA
MTEHWKRGLGFVMSGGLATVTDATVLSLLTQIGHLDPFSARLAAIACAMVVAFFAHRRWSFAVSTPATLAEFGKFVSVAATASAINYAVYAGILLLRFTTQPLLALLIATAVAMGVTYVGLRFGVFRRPND